MLWRIIKALVFGLVKIPINGILVTIACLSHIAGDYELEDKIWDVIIPRRT